jgi:hypothetical protein
MPESMCGTRETTIQVDSIYNRSRQYVRYATLDWNGHPVFAKYDSSFENLRHFAYYGAKHHANETAAKLKP